MQIPSMRHLHRIAHTLCETPGGLAIMGAAAIASMARPRGDAWLQSAYLAVVLLVVAVLGHILARWPSRRYS